MAGLSTLERISPRQCVELLRCDWQLLRPMYQAVVRLTRVERGRSPDTLIGPSPGNKTWALMYPSPGAGHSESRRFHQRRHRIKPGATCRDAVPRPHQHLCQAPRDSCWIILAHGSSAKQPKSLTGPQPVCATASHRACTAPRFAPL